MGTYEILKGLQKSAAQDDYIVFHLYRKISIFFSVMFIKLGISANFVTFLSMLSDFFVVYQMYLGNWIWAGILVNLAIILDCCDGEIARFNKTSSFYGEYLDEILGFVGITVVVLFAGYFLGSIWVGIAGMFGLLMNMGSSFLATNLFGENKKKIAKEFEEGIFGKIKGRVGFSNGFQRILITLAVLFQSIFILLVFGILINSLWILKLWLYRKQ